MSRPNACVVVAYGAYPSDMPTWMMGADSLDDKLRMWYEDELCQATYLECVRRHEPMACVRARYLFGNPFTRPMR